MDLLLSRHDMAPDFHQRKGRPGTAGHFCRGFTQMHIDHLRLYPL
jgi:hypothetical protein